MRCPNHDLISPRKKKGNSSLVEIAAGSQTCAVSKEFPVIGQRIHLKTNIGKEDAVYFAFSRDIPEVPIAEKISTLIPLAFDAEKLKIFIPMAS